MGKKKYETLKKIKIMNACSYITHKKTIELRDEPQTVTLCTVQSLSFFFSEEKKKDKLLIHQFVFTSILKTW